MVEVRASLVGVSSVVVRLAWAKGEYRYGQLCPWKQLKPLV